MQENNIKIQKEDDETDLVTEGNSILYVAQDQKNNSINRSKRLNKRRKQRNNRKIEKRKIEVIMLTGDNEKQQML